jgi:GTP cyclohydrolase III
MTSKGKELKRLLPSETRESYLSAIREFTQMTIKNPSFFNKTPEEQKEMAMATIQEHKEAGRNVRKEGNNDNLA